MLRKSHCTEKSNTVNWKHSECLLYIVYFSVLHSNAPPKKNSGFALSSSCFRHLFGHISNLLQLLYYLCHLSNSSRIGSLSLSSSPKLHWVLDCFLFERHLWSRCFWSPPLGVAEEILAISGPSDSKCRLDVLGGTLSPILPIILLDAYSLFEKSV